MAGEHLPLVGVGVEVSEAGSSESETSSTEATTSHTSTHAGGPIKLKVVMLNVLLAVFVVAALIAHVQLGKSEPVQTRKAAGIPPPTRDAQEPEKSKQAQEVPAEVPVVPEFSVGHEEHFSDSDDDLDGASEDGDGDAAAFPEEQSEAEKGPLSGAEVDTSGRPETTEQEVALRTDGLQGERVVASGTAGSPARTELPTIEEKSEPEEAEDASEDAPQKEPESKDAAEGAATVRAGSPAGEDKLPQQEVPVPPVTPDEQKEPTLGGAQQDAESPPAAPSEEDKKPQTAPLPEEDTKPPATAPPEETTPRAASPPEEGPVDRPASPPEEGPMDRAGSLPDEEAERPSEKKKKKKGKKRRIDTLLSCLKEPMFDQPFVLGDDDLRPHAHILKGSPHDIVIVQDFPIPRKLLQDFLTGEWLDVTVLQMYSNLISVHIDSRIASGLQNDVALLSASELSTAWQLFMNEGRIPTVDPSSIQRALSAEKVVFAMATPLWDWATHKHEGVSGHFVVAVIDRVQHTVSVVDSLPHPRDFYLPILDFLKHVAQQLHDPTAGPVPAYEASPHVPERFGRSIANACGAFCMENILCIAEGRLPNYKMSDAKVIRLRMVMELIEGLWDRPLVNGQIRESFGSFKG
ncbi:uncharacterized protein EMH_0050570 [Eimeria mitis]|uniref:Ubiquitin-like protease family profile domain-containing protein n=1 Tax=Eimeria mitis TaxID=44415 RepID=U6KC51_9EIME|nr:uncharacterized protein EMH_0050570 [Eimeria mitis]CDJ33063.1 hypothetical protein, conserved [Eimeria mitis]